MRAVLVREPGGPEVLELTEVERPEPAATEVLVRVRAAGVNPVDWKVRASGDLRGARATAVGWDVAGVVEAVAPGVTWLRVGDEVLGMPYFPHTATAYADYVTAPARHLVRKPAGLDFFQAAGLPLAGLTAWQALVDTADVQPGQRVLVHAAAGGVGHLAVQIAKARGAYVLGTASAGKHEFLRSLGVDEPVDYTAGPFEEAVSKVDVVVDALGPETSLRSLELLGAGGYLVSVLWGVDEQVAAEAERRGVRADNVMVEPDHLGLGELAALVDAGRLTVHVDKVFPLAEAGAAHAYGEAGRTSGKIVLAV
ncbi:NADP-dependent oxidoreductase [Crossiella sp. SN42]|uniref:NADP-dependent oxidoreductase n=1 Tax=Crossiella sp. SN42 TaxID=2944808 RepID=UPI00207C4AC9|nr:NADP-dependent oxidoreductase [Crossiella sp. SN42]MCO1581457.1 NADP-dependent oxidoreductase [Crossiella sp. SN42]